MTNYSTILVDRTNEHSTNIELKLLMSSRRENKLRPLALLLLIIFSKWTKSSRCKKWRPPPLKKRDTFTKLPLIFQNLTYLPYCCKSTLLPIYGTLNDIFFFWKISEIPRQIEIGPLSFYLSLPFPPFSLSLFYFFFF